MNISDVKKIMSTYQQALLMNKMSKLAKAKLFAEENKSLPKGQIVFFGDSITEMFDPKIYFPKKNIINRGISGNTSLEMLDRVKSNIINLEPTCIKFLGGCNDLNRSRTPKETAATIEEILYTLKTSLPNCLILVESVLPVNNVCKGTFGFNMSKARTNEDIDELNQYILDICNKYNLTYINTHDLLLKGGILDEALTLDGLHLSAAGYNIVSKKLYNFLP